MTDKWGELGEDGLDISVVRSGLCQMGFTYLIKTGERGNMDDLKLHGAPRKHSTRNYNPKSDVKRFDERKFLFFF